MKRLFLILALLPIALLFTSCKEKNTPQQDTNEYFVRYTIKSSWYVFGNVSYGDVNGTSYDLTGQKKNSWGVTIGPVKKGFKAWSRNDMGTSTNSANHAIEVSKNSGPFAQKATGINSASYIIDF